MSVVSYTQLKTQESGHDLTLFKESARHHRLDVNRYPVMLTEQEKASMNYGHVVTVIQGRVQSPSAAAGLDPSDLPPIIRRIDDAFSRELWKYKDTLATAVRNDKRQISTLDTQLESTIDKRNYALRYTLGGLAIFLIGAIPGYFIGASRNKQKDRANENLTLVTRHEQSAHRKAWMVEVNAFENERLKNANGFLKLSMGSLVKELQELESEGETDIATIKELRNVWKVFVVLFPDESDHEENGIKISDFLDHFREVE